MTIECTEQSCAYNRDGRCAARRIVVHAYTDGPRCWNYLDIRNKMKEGYGYGGSGSGSYESGNGQIQQVL